MAKRTMREKVLQAARNNPGLSTKQIAEIVNCSPSTVRKYLPAGAVAAGTKNKRRDPAGTDIPQPPPAGLGVGHAFSHRPLDGFIEVEDPDEHQTAVEPLPPTGRRLRPKETVGRPGPSLAVPAGCTPEQMLDEIEKVLRKNRYAGFELGPFEWYQQWNEINPELQRSERPCRGRHVKQRVPDVAVYSRWYEVTVDEINARWFSGGSRVLVRSRDPLEMAAEVASAWHSDWPTSTIINEIPSGQVAEAERRYLARGLRTNIVTTDALRLLQGHVNLVSPEAAAGLVAPAGSLLLQHGIREPRPAIEAAPSKSAGFTADSKDLGLSSDVDGNYEFIIDSDAHLSGPPDLEGLNCSEPLDVDVSPGMSRLLEGRYHNWRLAGHRAFKALTVDEQAELVRHDKRQELYERALRSHGNRLFKVEVPSILASLEQEAHEAGQEWISESRARQEAEDAWEAVLP